MISGLSNSARNICAYFSAPYSSKYSIAASGNNGLNTL